ncbi:MAG: Ig-like domain-containing protein [Gemmatimonadota bacterium]
MFGGYFVKNWTCGKHILVYGPSQWQAAVQTAANVWNTALGDPAAGGVPSLVWGGTTNGDTQILLSGSGSLWCGGTNGPPTFILMTAKVGSSCPTNAAIFSTALVHEFAHVMGFKDGALEKQISPTNCAIHLPDNGTINGNVCQHEVEYVYAVYGFRSAPAANFWSTPVVTGLAVSPTSVSIQVGQAQTLVPSLLVFARQMTPSAALGSTGVIWISDRNDIATVNQSNGIITGISAGSTIVRA